MAEKEILYSVKLDVEKAKKAWNEFLNQLKLGEDFFTAIKKTTEAIDKYTNVASELQNKNINLATSQNSLVSSVTNLNAVTNDSISILKSQVIEKEALNNSFTQEQQKISKTIEAYRFLNKERQNEIQALKLENKERSLDVKDYSVKIKENNKVFSTSESKAEKDAILEENASLREAIKTIDLLNHENNKRIKSIQDEVLETNKLIATEKELLSIEKVTTTDISNQIKETNNKIKAISEENKVIEENIKVQKEQQKIADNQQKLQTKTITSQSTAELNAETNRLLQNQKRVIEEQNQARQNELDKISAKIISLSVEAKEIGSNIQAQLVLKNSVKNNTDEAKAFKETIDKNIESLKNQKKEITDNIRLLSNKKDSLKNSNVEIINNTNVINENLNALTKQRNAINSLPTPEKNNKEELGFFASIIERIGNYSIGTVLSQSIRAVFQLITQFFQKAGQEFLQLERNIQIIRGLMNDTNTSFSEVNSKITAVAEKTGSSFSGASESINKIITAGITDIDEAMKVYENSIILARLSTTAFKNEQANMNDIINTAVLVMSNYNLKADKLPIVFNQLSLAATKSKLDIGDFAKYIGGLTSTFAPLNVSLNDTMSLFALFSNRLRSASEANTALTQIVKKLQSPTGRQELEGLKLGIDFTPSAIQEKGLTEWLKDFFAKISKTANPEDTLAKMFNLVSAKKGLTDLIAIFKDVNKEGKNAFETLSNDALNNTGDLKQKYEKIINSFSQRLETFSNSFINIFMGGLIGAKEGLSQFFDDFTFGLNVAIGLAKELFHIFDIGNGENALVIFANWLGWGLKNLLKGVGVDIEFIIKLLREFFVTLDYWTTVLIQGFKTLGAYLKYFTFDIQTKGFKKATDDLKNFLQETADIITKKSNAIDEAKRKLFDFDNYISNRPEQLLKNRLENPLNGNQKEEFLPPVTLVGSGQIDKNSEKLKDVLKDIDKASLAEEKFETKRKIANEKYLEDIKNAETEFRKIQNIIPQQEQRLNNDFLDPSKTTKEKEQITKDLANLQETKINSEKNYNDLLIGLEKRKNAEIAKINEEEKKKLDAERKKAINEHYKALIDNQKERINDVDINNPTLAKNDVTKLKNVKLKKLADIYKEYGQAFEKGSSDRAEHEKQASDTIKQISNNEKEIEKENLKNRLENSKQYYEKQLNNLKVFSLEKGLSEDQQLNNETALNKTRIKDLNNQLSTEKKLTFDQKKSISEEILKLENDNRINIIKIATIRRERLHEINLEEIQDTREKYDLLVKIGKESEQQQLLNSIEANNKEIAILQQKKRETQDPDKQRGFDSQIKKKENENKISENEITIKLENELKERIDKNFNDRIKSINFLKEQRLLSEKEVLNEILKANKDYYQALEAYQAYFIKKNGANPENESKKKELTDLRDKVKDIFHTINNITKDSNDLQVKEYKESIDKKVSILLSYFTNVKNMGEAFKTSGVSSLGNIFVEGSNSASTIVQAYKDITEAQTEYNKAQNQDDKNKIKADFDATGIKTGVEATVSSLNTLINTIPKLYNAYSKLSETYKTFGKDSEEVTKSTKEANEMFSEQLKIIPVLGGFLSAIARGITDLTGLTKSEEQKKKDEALSKSSYELSISQIKAQKESTETKLQLLDIEYKENQRIQTNNFTDQETFDNNMKKLEIDYQTNRRNIIEDSNIKLLEIANNYKTAMYGIQKDSYFNQRQIAYDEYLLEFNKLKNKASTQQEYDTAYQNYLNKVAALDLQEQTKNNDILYNLQKSSINLQQDSMTKSIQLAQLERDHKLQILEDEKVKGLVSIQQYVDKKKQIENEYQADINKINLDSIEKIRSLNEKDYQEELKAFDSLYKEKTNKVKSELQKQYDIIAEYQNKIKELTDKREEDQQLKTKRANQLAIDLANKKQELANKGSFFEQNSENFDIGNGIDTGNETLRKKAENDFTLGLISYQERNSKRQQLALEKEIYYETLLTKYRDPAKRKEINDKITEAKQEYYDFIFDKEKEAIDLEKTKAEREKARLEAQLKDRQEVETKYIAELDAKYKDAAGLYKTSFINATKDWIDFAKKEGLQKLGVSAYETLNEVGNTLNKNSIEAKKYLPNGTIANNSNINVTGNTGNNTNTGNVNNNVSTGINTNNTIASNNSNPFTNTTKTGVINPSNPFAPKTNNNVTPPIATATQKIDQNDPLRRKILDGIYSSRGSYFYDLYYPKSTAELIDYAEKNNIPMLAGGGVRKSTALVSEKGSEAWFNYPQMQNMYDFVKEATERKNIYNNSNSSFILNVNIQANSTDSKNLANQINTEVTNKLNKTAQNLFTRK